MLRSLSRYLYGLLVCFHFFFPLLDAAEPPVSVPFGAAKVDITPSYPVRMSGYGNRRAESEGIAQHIWAKAVAIGGDTGDGPAVWIAYENCGLTPEIRAEVAKQLKEHAGLKSERLVISVTHSHTAPCLTDWAPYIFGVDLPPEHQAHVDQYTRELTAKLVQVARDALAARRPAKLYWGQGKVGFAANRRVLKDGKWTGFGVQADGPVDHSLPILIARDSADKLLACVANYACHCTTLGGNFNQIAGDWAGYAQEFIESDQPGSVAMITIGCGADANPNPRRDDLSLCREHGRALADEVKRLIAGGDLKPLSSDLRCRLLHIDLPFAAPRSKDEWQERAKRTDATGYHAKKFLARLERGDKLPTSLSYPVASWSFGRDLAMVFLGGEVVVDYAVRLKSEFDATRLWISAYSNDVPCYIPSKRILAERGYEADQSMVFYARPQELAPDVEDLIVDAVQKVLPQWFYSLAKQAEFPPPKSPEESLQSIRVRPGMKVELVAAEPLVEDPVAFDWTSDGRLWVAEMRDYPNGMAWDRAGDPLGVPGGRIKLLSDTDGDGRYDKASIFLDNIPFPNGVKTWRNGVLVTAAPTIFYAEDTNGDGVADKRETLYEGFTQGNQQHRANGLRWGIDNWLYVANGDSGGRVKSHKTGAELPISGRDLRIRPDDGAIETQSGQTQFGRCRDDWGNWFGGNNSNPLWHYVLDDQYLRRNPNFAPPAVRRDVPEVRGAAPVFPLSRTLARFNDFHTANRFTSACSPEIYCDERLFPRAADVRGGKATPAANPPSYLAHVFICEPVHNLVHHEVMTADGVSFTSRRPDDERESEFFASADNWCRPVMARTGPDGALWIADMYRQVIEHPEWIPVTWQRKLELRAGSDRGRIYRVIPAMGIERKMPRLDRLDTPGLLIALDSPNGWQRDMAQQMLIWRNDQIAVPLLEQLAAESQRPTTRLHALATLDGMRRLRPEIAIRAIKDSHPGVRRHAVWLAESFVYQTGVGQTPVFTRDAPSLGTAIAAMASDPDPFVRQQVAYSLGVVKNSGTDGKTELVVSRIGQVLGEMAIRDAGNPHITAAILSSVHDGNARAFVQAIAAANPPAMELEKAVLGVVDASQANRLIEGVLMRLNRDRIAPLQTRLTTAAGLLEVVSRRNASLEERTLRLASEFVNQAFSAAKNEQEDVTVRVAAVRLLGVQPKPQPEDADVLAALLAPRNAPELQLAAAAALATRYADSAAQRLLADWRSHSPVLRSQILDTLLTRPSWTQEFLSAVEKGVVPAAHLDARRRQQLARHSDRALRDRAAKLLGSESPSSRAQVLDQFRHVAKMAGDPARGKVVFGKKCATCHGLDDVGQNVGPELMSLTDKSPTSLLIAILDPNRAVENKFLDYLAVTSDGRQFTGMISNETSNSVTLVGQEGKQLTLRRNELESLQSTGKSMMPEALEKDLTDQDLADTIAYVRSASAPPKKFPGNTPELAHVRDDGSIRLLAMHAKIYGPTLVFEDKYRNLGFWRHADDHAVWTMSVPKAGMYRVSVDYACDDAAAGDRFLMIVGEQTLGAMVEGTGSWDVYRSRSIGRLSLEAGFAELVMRADGPIRDALLDVRQIVLSPE